MNSDDPVNLLKQAAAAAALVNPLLKGMPAVSAAGSGSMQLPSVSSAEADLVGSLLKSNPALLLNPALLTLNPSLYAVQLAQLQLMSQQGGAGSAEAIRRLSGQLDPSDAMSAAMAQATSSTNPLAQVRKRKHEETAEPTDPMSALAGVLNLSSATATVGSKTSPVSSPRLAESPLDLSGSKKLDSPGLPKMPRLGEAEKMAASMGGFPFLHPLLAAGGLTPEALTRLQMGLPQASQSLEAAATAGGGGLKNPLERMSEIAKGSSAAAVGAQGVHQPPLSTSPGASARLAASGTRPSAWQSQWLNRGPESNKDIFKCVWCKESFSSLQLLTTHMKETKHFGASIPPSPTLPPSTPTSRPTIPSPNTQRPQPGLPPSVTSAVPTSAKPRDILKEQLPMPRKLVRGQDVWLGRGEQQTRDILKCMWCGESFRSLDLMTKHMQETKHYTKVISQEQLMSWKSPDTNTSGQNHVNAVLTCKVCEQAFSTLKELSDHMVKNNHYKQDETASSGGGPPPRRAGSTSPRAGPAVPMAPSPGQQGGKEKRKKSLPVRKLLELERAQQELTGQVKPSDPAGRIACEKCGDKILMHLFVDHIRQCVGPTMLKSSTPPMVSPASSSAVTSSMADLNRFLASTMTTAGMASTRTPSVSPPTSSIAKKPLGSPSSPPTSTPKIQEDEPRSILGSLEKMVQNNFGTKKRAPDNNMSILQRLGIDEGVDYNKPLMDSMALFRSPSQMTAALAAAAASGNFPPGFLPPPPFSTATSTTTRSNSSECSSPDRFRTAADRPSSTKSAASAKSPAPADEVPLAASMGMSKKSTTAAASNTLSDDNDKKSNEAGDDKSNADQQEADEEMEQDEDQQEPSPDAKRPASRRRTRSSSRKTEVGEPEVDISSKCETACSPTPSKSSDVDSHLQRSASHSPREMIKEDEAGSTTEDEVAAKKEVASSPVSGDAADKEATSAEVPASTNTSKKKPNSHPLAALQMLCDKTEKKSGQGGHSSGPVKSGSGNGSAFGPTTDPGAILAFSWACNQAVVNDSLLKCPFCDTPFISKGAYRHHLSKMHFVKEGGGVVSNPDVKLLKSGGGGSGGPSPNNAPSSTGSSDSKEENAQSKFQKYSQLAKQLSCGSSQP